MFSIWAVANLCFFSFFLYSSLFSPRRRGPVNGDECYFWRTTGCHFGDKCRYKHIPDQKGKDRKPWQPWTCLAFFFFFLNTQRCTKCVHGVCACWLSWFCQRNVCIYFNNYPSLSQIRVKNSHTRQTDWEHGGYFRQRPEPMLKNTNNHKGEQQTFVLTDFMEHDNLFPPLRDTKHLMAAEVRWKWNWPTTEWGEGRLSRAVGKWENLSGYFCQG